MKSTTVALAIMSALAAAGPSAAVDYVQCNAMRAAYDRELAALIAERTSRHDYGVRSTVKPCGLPPIAGAATAEASAYAACRQSAFDVGVREWDERHKQLDPRTGKSTGSPIAMTLLKIYMDMSKGSCPLPG